MERYNAGKYDVCVIGAGHAGVEAAIAAAKLGCSVILFSINLDSVGNMPCNPSIGGTAKGHLVCEIDALGGIMGIAADKNAIQIKMLNRGKGPAVHSLRAQVDRRKYSVYIKHLLESTENLDLKQAEITEIIFDETGGKKSVKGVVTANGAIYETGNVIIATGTYLKGRVLIGRNEFPSGPDGLFPANALSDCLKSNGIQLRRFKTGTPARVHKGSLDFSKMIPETGEDNIRSFSDTTKSPVKNRVQCYLTYTNKNTKEVILKNLDRSPLYSGMIKGIGPRYCPSIEDKVVRFADKERHQLFLEPMGLETEEMYVQGISSSLPEDVQTALLKTISGLENVKIMRTAYAIEYDCADPLQLKPSLEFKNIHGLFGAGQFNGTSGYEEAAAQGLIAGINAANRHRNREPLVLDRSTSYIGTLIDDLVTKGTNEPYRMMTSRSEYRLLLRQDNADARLTPVGYEQGLIDKKRYRKLQKKLLEIDKELERLKTVNVAPGNAVNRILESKNSTPIQSGIKLSELIKRPEMSYDDFKEIDTERPKLSEAVTEQVDIRLRYGGYIKRQLAEIESFKKEEQRRIPKEIDYLSISGLRLEARQKLDSIRPESLGQAGRISGVSPADIAVLMLYLEKSDEEGKGQLK